MAIDFHKWKAEPSGMHSHAEHGNEEALAILSRFVFVAVILEAFGCWFQLLLGSLIENTG